MRKFFLVYLFLLGVYILFHQVVKAENIHFNDNIYNLKYSDVLVKMIENEYYQSKENRDYWTSMVGINYYPDISSPLKSAAELDKEIESKENFLLLKFVQNKKQNIAIISYLENVVQNENRFFIYHVCKYEKQQKKGIIVLKFSKKYVFNTKEEITRIAEEIKRINNDYIEQLIISPIPPIVEKQMP